MLLYVNLCEVDDMFIMNKSINVVKYISLCVERY